MIINEHDMCKTGDGTYKIRIQIDELIHPKLAEQKAVINIESKDKDLAKKISKIVQASLRKLSF